MDRCSHEAAQKGGLDSPLFKVCQVVRRSGGLTSYGLQSSVRDWIFIANNEMLHNSV